MAAESGKLDPMHQFQVQEIFPGFELFGHHIAFTNSALWMLLATAAVTLFTWGGMKRQLVPSRWQAAVETFTGFIDNMLVSNIGEAGRKYVPFIFTLFMFILFVNMLGMLPISVVGGHAFTATSHPTVTAVLAFMTFAIVLIVGFWKHGLHFFSLFVPDGLPWYMIPFIFPIEVISFLIRPFSLALRLFVAMTAGHILLKILGSFVVSSGSAGVGMGALVGIPSFLLMVGINALELLVAGIQAYVFALLASIYINDAENLH